MLPRFLPHATHCFERVVLNVRGLTHREPLVDEVDFERFVRAIEGLMQAGRDVLWVLAGRTDSSIPQIKGLLAKFKSNIGVFYLCYNAKQMQQCGCWQRQRGMANSKSVEQAFYCYKGKTPKLMPKNRLHVDYGTSLFNQVMSNVPVLAPKLQAFVPRGVRDTSLDSMVGGPLDEDEEEQMNIKLLHQEDNDGAGDQPRKADLPHKAGAYAAARRKNRKLFKQLSG